MIAGIAADAEEAGAMVKRQDSGQPPFDSAGDPQADKPANDKHPEARKRHEPGPADAPAEGNDPSLTRAPARVREVPPPDDDGQAEE